MTSLSDYWSERRKRERQEKEDFEQSQNPQPQQQQTLQNIEQMLRERLELAENLKNQGNEYFKKQEYGQAVTKYMESEKTIPLEMFRTLLNKEWRDLVEKLCTNIVMCFLKSNLYARAHELAQNYIRIFPENPKLKYQDACALQFLEKYDEALQSLKSAILISPGDKIIRQKFQEIKELRLKAKENEQGMWGGKLIATSQQQQQQEEVELPPEPTKSNMWKYVGYGLAAIAFLGAGFFLYSKRRR